MTAPTAPAASDRTTLFGVLGIVGAFCCWPLGVVFAILCLMEAKKYSKPPTLAYVAFGILVLGLIFNIIALSSGMFSSLSR
jgi:predicted membrane channel-forming protein YqfA (hemolysin III family)